MKATVMHVTRFTRQAVLTALAASLLSGCAAIGRIENIGKPPALTAIKNPTTNPGYVPVQMPMPAAQPASYNPNSLWRNGARGFFKDQRAHRVGDILTVKVDITDQANISDETKRSRDSQDDSSISSLFGLRKFFNAPVPGDLANTNSATTLDGKGSVDRSEALQTNVAAVVTQVLPNGNLVIEGKQDIRVNFEMRELSVAGIVRPEDIQSDNTIDSSKIAEARISYGGKGQLTDVQQQRYGSQLLDILLPF
jgi:flagellar L-ring protein precursor FlgH